MIRLIIAEDHQAFIDGISAYLQYDEDVKLIDTATNGKKLVDSVHKLLPDVVITDLRMPVLDGLEAIKYIKLAHPNIKLIALTMFDNTETVKKVIDLGVNGYLLKNSGLKVMKEAIKTVMQDKIYIDANLLVNIDDQESTGLNKQKTILSKREKEILHLIGQGKSSTEIAEALFISKTTVDTHRKNMCRKLGINGTNALLKYAIEKKY